MTEPEPSADRPEPEPAESADAGPQSSEQPTPDQPAPEKADHEKAGHEKAVHEKVFDSLEHSVSHGSTFAPNELGMAAGLATLHELDEQDLVARSARLGARLLELTTPLVGRYDVTVCGLPRGHGRGTDVSNPVIAVDHDACILCDRCVRACDDLQGNDVIGRSGKGYATRISFDLDDPMGASSCVTCGECVASCPTGALTNKPIHDAPIRPRTELDAVDSVCPYCGVGCGLTYYVDRERGSIAFAEGRAQPGSKGRGGVGQ